jgi:hypothetical protein
MNSRFHRSHGQSSLARYLAGLYLALSPLNDITAQAALQGPSASVHANPVPFQGLVDLPAMRWSSEQRLSLGGVSMSIWTFDTSASVMDITKTLAEQTDYFQRVLVQEGVLVLSGLRKGRHWLAEFGPSAKGVSGRISGLSGNGFLPDQSAPSGIGDARAQWRPPWSAQIFSMDPVQRGEPSLVLLRLFGPGGTARDRVNDYLLENAWTAAREPGMTDTWTKGSDRLSLYLDCTGENCFLLGYLHPSFNQTHSVE